MYGYCQEKIDVGRYWDLKGLLKKWAAHPEVLHGRKPLWSNDIVVP